MLEDGDRRQGLGGGVERENFGGRKKRADGDGFLL